MRTTVRHRNVAAWWTGCVFTSVLCGANAACWAQAFTSNVTITTGTAPSLSFIETGTPITWVLTGGGTEFSLHSSATGLQPLRIKPNAPLNSLFIDDNGHVGMGTSAVTGDNLTVRSDVTSCSLHLKTAQENKRLQMRVGSTGDASFSLSDTGGSTTPFDIEFGAPNSLLHLDSTGIVGIGTTSPDPNSRLDIRSSLTNGALLKRATADAHYLRIENSAGTFRTGVQGNGHAQFGMLTPGKGLFLTAGGTGKMEINASGQFSFGNPPPAITTHAMVTSTGALLTIGGVWTDASSRTLKQDIEPITSDEARDTVRALQPVGYRYRNELDERYVGFIAEDVPELVATRDRKGLAPMDITAVLTKVVQDQDRQLSQQQQLIERQEAALKELTRQMAELKQMVIDSRDPLKE